MGDRLKTYEVFLGDRDHPVVIVAFTKAHAIMTANELYPDVPFTEYQIYERPEW
jgi:hypothetical protein